MKTLLYLRKFHCFRSDVHLIYLAYLFKFDKILLLYIRDTRVTFIPFVFKSGHIKLRSFKYSHLFNKSGGLNKREGGAKVPKSLNMEVGINVEGGIFWEKLVHKSNKRGVEGGKI